MNLLLTIALSLASLLPQAENNYWRDSIPQEMRQSYIAYGEQYAGKPWTVLPWTVFAENKLTGNRVNYEGICFEKRRHLAALVMAEIIEGKSRFTADIIDDFSHYRDYRRLTSSMQRQPVSSHGPDTCSKSSSITSRPIYVNV